MPTPQEIKKTKQNEAMKNVYSNFKYENANIKYGRR